MLEEALVVLLYIVLIVFVIVLITLGIKLIGTIKKTNILLDNITKKAESLDGVFDMIDYTTSKFGAIGEMISGYIGGIVKKLTGKKGKRKEENE